MNYLTRQATEEDREETGRWLPLCFLLLLGGSLVGGYLAEVHRQDQLETERTVKPCPCLLFPSGSFWVYQPFGLDSKPDESLFRPNNTIECSTP